MSKLLLSPLADTSFSFSLLTPAVVHLGILLVQEVDEMSGHFGGIWQLLSKQDVAAAMADLAPDPETPRDTPAYRKFIKGLQKHILALPPFSKAG